METRFEDLIIELVREAWESDDAPPADELNADSPLLGPDGVLSSMAFVSLLLSLEQELEARHGVAVSLVDEKAMSQRNSPFGTIGSLARYVEHRVLEAA